MLSVFDFVAGVVSVLDLYFGECSSCSIFVILSDRELVRLVFLVALKCSVIICMLCCFDALRRNCGNWFNWFYWSYCNIRLACVNLGYLAFNSKLVTTVMMSLVGCT